MSRWAAPAPPRWSCRWASDGCPSARRSGRRAADHAWCRSRRDQRGLRADEDLPRRQHPEHQDFETTLRGAGTKARGSRMSAGQLSGTSAPACGFLPSRGRSSHVNTRRSATGPSPGRIGAVRRHRNRRGRNGHRDRCGAVAHGRPVGALAGRALRPLRPLRFTPLRPDVRGRITVGELDRLRVTHTAMAASVLHSRPERGRAAAASQRRGLRRAPSRRAGPSRTDGGGGPAAGGSLRTAARGSCPHVSRAGQTLTAVIRSRRLAAARAALAGSFRVAGAAGAVSTSPWSSPCTG